MLNGRVYGARKPHHRPGNVFDNIPDKEPEFVEWGYGGMGSVRSGGMWAKVQSDQKNFLGQTEERGRAVAPATKADDDDDGSGMGWVKKRREERERQKRGELAAASKTDVGSAPNSVSALVPVQGTAHDSIPISVAHDVTTVTPVQPETEDDDDESSEEDDEEAEDESSSTEQDDDDGDQVRHIFFTMEFPTAEYRSSMSSRSWVRALSASAAIVINRINYAYLISIIQFGISPTHTRLAVADFLILRAIPTLSRYVLPDSS